MRQKIRQIVMFVILLAFPVFLNWYSPVVIVFGAASGIVTGSFLVFAVLFVSSLFAGRLWCSWLCPAGCIQDIVAESRTKRYNGPIKNMIKWAIWGGWIAMIAFFFVAAGGIRKVDPLFFTESGISVSEPARYVVYYGVVFLIFGLSFLGKRAACHSICWMSPFMILGSTIGRALRLPQAHLEAERENCKHCGKCTKACPMSLDVQKMAESGRMSNVECVLCARCADTCPSKTIRLAFGRDDDRTA